MAHRTRRIPGARGVLLLLSGQALLLTSLLATADEARVERTRKEVLALIEKGGKTPPEWWDKVPLSYPKTLKLDWPKPPRKAWSPRVNISQHMFTVINENPRRWQQGVRFLHHVLSVNKDDPEVRQKAMGELGHCYHDLLQDWVRGAYWWGQLEEVYPNQAVGLAHCYWMLGSKEMASEELALIKIDYSRYGSAIKLWSDMGELDRALRLAAVSAGKSSHGGALMGAGDACRKHGRQREAIAYYQKVLAMPMRERSYIQRNKPRARIAIDAIKKFELLDLERIPDGVYSGKSPSYNGDLNVQVDVRGGRIAAARIGSHRDKQYFSALVDAPKKIVARQSLKGIDATTGATITSQAVIHAAANALAAGMPATPKGQP